MGKIGDLWVRLGLKKDDYTRGLKEAQREGEGFGKSVAALGSKAKIAFAAVAAAVTGVIAAVKDLAKQNQALGDAWNRMSSGMAASWDTFKTAIASMDFTNLLSNMREANRLARDLYNAKDALGEIGSAYDISYGQQAAEINQLRIDLADATKSDKERLEAGEKLLKIYKQLESNPTRGLANVSDAEVDRVADKLGYNLKGAAADALDATRQEVKDFFVWLGSEQGAVYNEAAQKVAQQMGGINSSLGQTFMRNAANNGMERFAQLAVAYNQRVNDKTREEMAQAVRASGEQDARFLEETRRIQTQMNTIRNRENNGPSGSPKEKEVDLLAQQVALIREESAELAAVRAEDEEMARLADEQYEKWREMQGFEPPKLWDDDMTRALEKGLQASVQMGEEMDDLKAKSEELGKAISENLVSAIEDGLVGSFNALADVLAGVTDGGMEQVVKALLEPLADMAIKAGTLIMMSGTAIEALKKSLVGFFGGSAVVAGAALVAVGVAAKAGLAAIGNRASSGTGISSVSSSASPYGGATGVQSAELVVRVEGEVKGSSIILSGQNTLKEWNR